MNLPTWKVERIGGKLGVTCPRRDCGGKALVSRKWLKSSDYKSRSCTYCFRANAIPKEFK